MLCDLTRVLFIPHGRDQPWFADLVAALGTQHQLTAFDAARPAPAQFAGVDVVVDQGGHASKGTIDVAAREGVKLWQVLGTGLDHTEVAHILGTGMRLANTPGQFSSIALAEHALFLMLCLTRQLRTAERNVRGGEFNAPMAEELDGRTLGLVGLGASGRELAQRAHALGMTVNAVDAVAVDPAVLDAFGVRWCGQVAELPRLLGDADFVSLHVPLTSQTTHLIDADRLAMMKRSAFIINVARGRIIDEAALVEALQQGRLGGAGLDVFADEPPDPGHPLLHMDNVIATPHVAGITFGTSRRRAAACAENVRRIAEGLAPLHEVVEIP
jgi:D-3-phosphoglycerate dehydrogenase / 2-oxoglutarate reductase